MHKIWIINLEEVIGHKQLDRLLCKHFGRYMLMMNPGDIIISPFDLPQDFLDYAASLRSLSTDFKWIIKPENKTNPYYLADSIIADERVMDYLRTLAQSGKYCFDPFYESLRILKLSERTGIPVTGTAHNLVRNGLIRKLNEKVYFKELSSQLGIETIPGYTANSIESLKEAISKVCRSSEDRAIVRKSFSGGGFGNFAGTGESLHKAMEENFEVGDYLVEPLLKLENTVGSMVVMGDGGSEYLGCNSQLIGNYGWIGCRYPFEDEDLSLQVREMSMKYTHEVYKMGARGLLNIDWGIVKEEEGSFRIYALEINLRRNGLNYVLQTAKNCFDFSYDRSHLLYYSDFCVSPHIDSFSDLLKKTAHIEVNGRKCLISRDHKGEGIIFTTPLINHKAGLLIAGESAEFIKSADQQVKKELGDGNEL